MIIGWTPRERVLVGALGLLALAGVAVRQIQRQHPLLGVAEGPTPPTAQWETLVRQARQVNVNQATAEALERLPEIGPAIAQRIVDYRAAHGVFRQPADLLQVPGIGPKLFEAIRDYVVVQ